MFNIIFMELLIGISSCSHTIWENFRRIFKRHFFRKFNKKLENVSISTVVYNNKFTAVTKYMWQIFFLTKLVV